MNKTPPPSTAMSLDTTAAEQHSNLIHELPYPTIEYATNNSVLYPIDAIDGTSASIAFTHMEATPITLCWAIKGQDEPKFEPIVRLGSTSGSIEIPIPKEHVSACIGHTVLIWYTATVSERLQTSLVLELEIQDIREADLRKSLPVFVHSKLESSTWWLNMYELQGDETIKIKSWPMIQAGQRLFVTVAGDQHQLPYSFFWIAFDHIVTVAEANPDHVFEFRLSRNWMSRRQDYSALTTHMGVIWDGAEPVLPQHDDPVHENPLPINAQDFHLRTTTLLRVDPTLNLPQPQVPESLQGVLSFVELCCGSAHLVVGAWPDIATTNKISLSCKGTSVGGEDITVTLTPLRAVTTAEVQQGLEMAISNAQLSPFLDGSSITLQLDVTFPGDEPVPFNPVLLRLFKSLEIFDGFDGEPNKFIATGEIITTAAMTITMIQAATTSHGGIYNYGDVPGYMSGPAIVMCFNQSGFAVPPQITGLQFNVACKCLRFAFVHLDGAATIRFYDEGGEILETRILNSNAGGRHQWVEFKAPIDKLLSRVEVEVGDHCYMDNFTMCAPAV
ncbi:Uncharacterized protein AC502_3784 [Pseudomonas syringae pv. maculicola]|uniref:hypothetical protein n=1 Tax=Pseudomonas syringae group genomosp. 3 TaxID=251701 RepID=UPI0006CDEEB1|nr:hypothetical protein [Pseudomonas syringae group genomosp. 3]KPB95905.1 Uncharacterized protein AC502_3784 [Pseudomonas syringae pv. maculicola]